MINLTFIAKYWLQRTSRPARFWKPKFYQAIPHYVKPNFIDLHDTYKLRSIQQVKAQLKERQFQLILSRNVYKPSDIRRQLKQRKIRLRVPLKQFQLTQLQLQRLKVLVGSRYNQQTNELILNCEQFPTLQQNITKIHETFYEIMMECKRAP